jgi:transposase
MKMMQDNPHGMLKEMVLLLEENLAKAEQAKSVLEIQKETLSAEKETLSAEKETLSAEKELLALQVEELKRQVAELKRLIFGSKRERFISNQNPEQLSLSFDIDEKNLQDAIDTETQTVTYERKKASKPHPGRMALPSHLPVKEIILEPTEDVTGMTCIGEEITEELEITPAKFFIIRTIRPVYISKEDETGSQHQVIAPLNRPIPKCMAGIFLLATLAVDKFVYHLPYYRQRQRFRQENIEISASTIDSWMQLLSKLLLPLYVVLRAYVMECKYVQADESTIKVQDGNKPGTTHLGYMWVFNSPVQKSVFFEYDMHRSSKAALKSLAGFSGYLQSDGYDVYEQIVKGRKDQITHLSCWAHARRGFDKALKNDKARSEVVLGLIQQLYAIEREAREANLTAEQRKELRLDKSLADLNKIGAFIAENRFKVLPSSSIGKAFEYCIHRWDTLLNYLKDGNLEIDNNLIENSIRPLALGRKNFLFAGSHHAAQNIAMFYSFFASCKKNDINPLDCIRPTNPIFPD